MGHFLANLLAKLCADEVMAWLPSITLRITQVAVSMLPKARRERYDEEWRAHLSEVPGALTKSGIACCFLCAAIKIRFLCAAMKIRSRQTDVKEIALYGAVVTLLVLRLPLMGVMSAVWALRARCCYVVHLALELPGRDLGITIDRIPLGLALHLALSRHVCVESLDRSPYHYSIWCSRLSVEVEEFILTRVFGCYSFLRFGEQGPLPLQWRNIKVGSSERPQRVTETSRQCALCESSAGQTQQ